MPRSRRDIDKRVPVGLPDDSQRIVVVRQFFVMRMAVGFDRQRQREGGDANPPPRQGGLMPLSTPQPF